MSNVLPQDVRKAVWRMYRTRFLTAMALVLLVVALLAGLAFVPSYLALEINSGAVTQQSVPDLSQQDDRVAVAHAETLQKALSPILSATTTTALVEGAIAARPAGVQLQHITATPGSPGTIILSGIAASIAAVSQYQSALRADKNFSGVSIPVGDLAGTANGQFSITLSADF